MTGSMAPGDEGCREVRKPGWGQGLKCSPGGLTSLRVSKRWLRNDCTLKYIASMYTCLCDLEPEPWVLHTQQPPPDMGETHSGAGAVQSCWYCTWTPEAGRCLQGLSVQVPILPLSLWARLLSLGTLSVLTCWEGQGTKYKYNIHILYQQLILRWEIVMENSMLGGDVRESLFGRWHLSCRKWGSEGGSYLRDEQAQQRPRGWRSRFSRKCRHENMFREVVGAGHLGFCRHCEDFCFYSEWQGKAQEDFEWGNMIWLTF